MMRLPLNLAPKKYRESLECIMVQLSIDLEFIYYDATEKIRLDCGLTKLELRNIRFDINRHFFEEIWFDGFLDEEFFKHCFEAEIRKEEACTK
jgi:hypothetical protein